MLFLLLLISGVCCSDSYDLVHNAELFLNYSYGGDYFDICQEASRDLLENRLGDCIGPFCNGTNYTGYVMAHIITNDICNMNIMGNVILSYYGWILNLRNVSYDIAVSERKDIYGEIFDKAKEAVAYCCVDDESSTKAELALFSLTITLSIISSAITAGIISAVMVSVGKKERR